jgi:hypothetical protein
VPDMGSLSTPPISSTAGGPAGGGVASMNGVCREPSRVE